MGENITWKRGEGKGGEGKVREAIKYSKHKILFIPSLALMEYFYWVEVKY